ncbi:uncharacterized protein [Bos taurus]|uniref:uncharacterized protein n=1 Tax=Bos taurus TaxID=9913 RepID=UPI0028CB5C63|nr:uncharacterized protein LOC132346864 [Bos taurus]
MLTSGTVLDHQAAAACNEESRPFLSPSIGATFKQGTLTFCYFKYGFHKDQLDNLNAVILSSFKNSLFKAKVGPRAPSRLSHQQGSHDPCGAGLAPRLHAPLPPLPNGPARRSHALGSRSPLSRTPLPTPQRTGSPLTRSRLSGSRSPLTRTPLPAPQRPGSPLTRTPLPAPQWPGSPLPNGPASRSRAALTPVRRAALRLSQPSTPARAPRPHAPGAGARRARRPHNPAPRRGQVLAAHTPPARRRPSQRPGLSSPPGARAVFCEKPVEPARELPRAAEGRLPEAGRREGGGGRASPGAAALGLHNRVRDGGCACGSTPWLWAGRFRRLPARRGRRHFLSDPGRPASSKPLCARTARWASRPGGAQRDRETGCWSSGGWTEASSGGGESFIRAKPT